MSQTLINLVTTPEQFKDFLTTAMATLHTTSMPPEAARLEVLKRKETLTTEEVEVLYGMKANTLRKRRVNGEGPAYSKDGDRVLYTHTAIKKYLEARRQKTHDQP